MPRKVFYVRLFYAGDRNAVDYVKFKVPADVDTEAVKKTVKQASAICKVKGPLECSTVMQMVQSIADQFGGEAEIVPFIGDLVAQ